ncbi:BnaA06g40100D [Brassica napus]|uniref:BnaA06g40100D protein n=1 Tax=Brassica napus TaxID=3708 RepID=A0A078JDZ9_BRANA|nr:BnaA06g40100D [Brassica napus]
MLRHLIRRRFSPSFQHQPSKLSPLRLLFSTTVSPAERLYNHLQSSTSNLETELTSSKAKLDASCFSYGQELNPDTDTVLTCIPKLATFLKLELTQI